MKRQNLEWYTAAIRQGEERALVMVETYAPSGSALRIGEFHTRITSFSTSGVTDELRLFGHSSGIVSGNEVSWIETSLQKFFPGAAIDVKTVNVE